MITFKGLAFFDRRAILLAMDVTLLLPGAAPKAAEIRPAADARRPFPPQESVACCRLPAGFRIELHGYNLDGHLDIVELNRTGVRGRKVRHIRANEAARKPAERETHDPVKLLEDSDGDGRIDCIELLRTLDDANRQ